MSDPTRRWFLGRVAIGSVVAGNVALAGCLSRGDDGDPPPIDVDEDGLAAIAAIDVPYVPDELPVEIPDEPVVEGRDRVESLLSSIPDDLAAEIPNEAVRQYIDEERASARDRLDDIDPQQPNYSQLVALQGARGDAAEAEGAYAGARSNRTREDVYAAADPYRDQFEKMRSNLTRTGEDAHRVLRVYDAVERHLRATDRSFEHFENHSPLESEVSAAGDAAGTLEVIRTRLETASHLLEYQTSRGNRTFDDEFEATASELLAEIRNNFDAVPTAMSDAADLFDAPVTNTPREEIAREIVLMSNHFRPDRIQDDLNEGWIVRALNRLFAAEHSLRTLDSLRSRIDDGDFERPDDGDAVRETKETAIDAVETLLTDSDYPYLLQGRVDAPIVTIRRGDRAIETSSHSPDRTAVQAMGRYAVAVELARTLPETTEWFADMLY